MLRVHGVRPVARATLGVQTGAVLAQFDVELLCLGLCAGQLRPGGLLRHLLGDGSQWGIDLSYTVQEKPEGIAQAFLLAENLLADGSSVCLILGDNIFYGKMGLDQIVAQFREGATVFGYPVRDPERYGVVEFADDGRVLSLEEKPEHPKSHYAVPGLYLYDCRVVELTRALQPSARGELEITDLNRAYLELGMLRVEKLGRGIAWLDTGTPASLFEAGVFIQAIEQRQGLKISCPEEVAYRRGYISSDQLRCLANSVPDSDYRNYMEQVLAVSLVLLIGHAVTVNVAAHHVLAAE